MSFSNQSVISFSHSCLPISERLHHNLIQILTDDPNAQGNNIITINFKDKSYSVENGGFHPVEIALTQIDKDQYALLYITDFSYCNNASPDELEKDIDFEFDNSVVFTRYGGWVNINTPDIMALYTTWEENFLDYLNTGVYNQIKIQCH